MLMKGAKACPKNPNVWMIPVTRALTGVGRISAEYWIPMFAAIFKTRREDTDADSFPISNQRKKSYYSHLFKVVRTEVESLPYGTISSITLKTMDKAMVMKMQNFRPHLSSMSMSNRPAGNSDRQAREKDTNTELLRSFRE